jgi:hypothetical protein
MNVLEVVSVVASVVSIILAGFTIWLALYMFNQTKNTEAEAKAALASIKSQMDTLQKLTGRMMDRLTTAVTAPRAADEAIVLLVSTLRDIPTTLAANLRAPAADASQQALWNEVLTAYIATYFYAGITNVASQAHLPPLADVKEDDFFKKVVDSSFNDFRLLEDYIGKFDANVLGANRLYHLYTEASQEWRPFVKDSTAVYRERMGGQ